jgi:phospholipase/carboxylesterase
MSHNHQHTVDIPGAEHITEGDVKYLYVPGKKEAPVIVLLHGTGGDETDLIDIGRFFGPDNPILSIRGRISENGMNRFFKRHAEGVFDLQSLHEEEDWLLQTTQDLLDKYDLNKQKVIAVGHSNGANVAVHAILDNEQTPWQSVVALHAMQLEEIDLASGRGKDIFITHGKFDPIVPQRNFNALVKNLTEAGVMVSTFQQAGSHGVSNEELNAARIWLHANELI